MALVGSLFLLALAVGLLMRCLYEKDGIEGSDDVG